jgi:ubiquinone/menaquinone biosynthesis C-methylase UbiE/uncharacterized protein YbaR (Trm112 family)
MSIPPSLLACPRCDKTPLDDAGDRLHCKACDVDFPLIDGIPWLFAEPQAALGEWRGRLQFALQTLSHEIATLEQELKSKEIPGLARRRVERYRKCVESHRKKLKKILRPIDVQSLQGNLESYLALRTRLPSDQGLNTYYANVHRDWAWGDEENAASLKQIRAVLHEHADLGNVLVLGAGAGRLAYDIHTTLKRTATIAVDFNPLLMFIAKAVTGGAQVSLYEFPLAPRALEDDAVLRKLAAPEAVDEDFHLVLADALRPPFAEGAFDTVVTPWLIDIVSENLTVFAARINRLLKEGGRWVNFGSLAFASPSKARCYSPEEVKAIVAESGFSDPYVSQATIPYMCSPASRHGRREHVFTFSAYRERGVDRPERHVALPDWLVTGKEPVPLSPSFRQQAMTTQIYSFIMSLIDGRRSIRDMAAVLEKQRLMTREEAIPAIRTFLTKMYDDSQRQTGH